MDLWIYFTLEIHLIQLILDKYLKKKMIEISKLSKLSINKEEKREEKTQLSSPKNRKKSRAQDRRKIFATDCIHPSCSIPVHKNIEGA